MDQSVLDPRTHSTVGAWRPPESLPRSLRDFGRFPNVNEWLPGDLVLVSGVQPTRMSQYIVRCQTRGGWPEVDARWHHAAVYIGDYELCEATVNRVKVSSLYDHYVSTHLMRVRRDPLLSTDERWRITVRSLRRLGKRYGFGKAMAVWWQSLYGFWKDKKGFILLPGKTVICSSLFAEAYSSTTLRTMGNTDHSIPTPAFLSHTDLLRDVQTTWRSIA